jgi:hypothetical protein
MFKLFGILLLGVAALSGGTYYIVRRPQHQETPARLAQAERPGE